MKLAIMMLTLTFALAIAAPARAEEPELVDSIVAQVNSEIITRANYLRELQYRHEELTLQMQGKSSAEFETEYERLKTSLLDSMIDDLLLEQMAKELDVNLDIEAEVNRRILVAARQGNLKDVRALEEALRNEGFEPDEMRSALRKQVQHQYVLEREVVQPLLSRGGTIEQFEVARKQYLKKLRDNAFVKISPATDPT